MLWASVLKLCSLAGIYRRFDGTCYFNLQFYPEEGGGPHSRSDHSHGEKGRSYCSRPHSAVTLSKCLWQFSVWEVRGSNSGDHEQPSLLWRYAVSIGKDLRELRGIMSLFAVPWRWRSCDPLKLRYYKSTRLNMPVHLILQLSVHLLERSVEVRFD